MVHFECLFVLVCGIVTVRARPPTRCDIDDLNAKLRIISQKIDSINYYLNRSRTEEANIQAQETSLKSQQDERKTWLSGENIKRDKSIRDSFDSFMRNYNSTRTWNSDRALLQAISNSNQLDRGNLTLVLTLNNNLINILTAKLTKADTSMNWGNTNNLNIKINAIKALLGKTVRNSISDLTDIGNELQLVTLQVQRQQFAEFEKARSEKRSGIKQLRATKAGSETYYSEDFNGNSFAAVRDVPQLKNTLGIGEFVGVLNGIEFRSPKMNYEGKTASRNSNTYEATDPLNTQVLLPSGITSKSIGDQITDMRNLFQSYMQQNSNSQAYSKYFKPILSYLEGSWVTNKDNSVEREKAYYTSHTGLSDKNENLPYNPRVILSFKDNKPLFASWSTRIVTHEVNTNLTNNFFLQLTDPTSLRRNGWNSSMFANSAAARFDLSGLNYRGDRVDQRLLYTYLDSLMEQVPGKENYVGNIDAKEFDSDITSSNPNKVGQKINGAFYHCPYELNYRDDFGVTSAQRTFSDRVYMAMTNQNQVASYVLNSGMSTRMSYAVPIEVFYTTPLNDWNPFQINFVSNCNQVTGKGTKEEPFSAWCPSLFYITPEAFYSGGPLNSCDVTKNYNGLYFFSPALNSAVCVVASGYRTLLPQIIGIDGRFRQRFPIMPASPEGSSVFKSINALQDSLKVFQVNDASVNLMTSVSNLTVVTPHQHSLVISEDERSNLLSGSLLSLKVKTTQDSIHQHIFTLKRKMRNGVYDVVVTSCDSDDGNPSGTFCFDRHSEVLTIVVK